MPAKFHKFLAMCLQDINETKRYGRTHTRTDENSILPLKLRFGRGYNSIIKQNIHINGERIPYSLHGHVFLMEDILSEKCYYLVFWTF